MRTKQAFKNLISSLMLELVVALSGIIVPRFFTALYGSSVNGLVSSISQFITYMSLVEAGIGAASLVALYGPLARKDYKSISSIVSAARRFYMRSGWIFIGLVALLIVLYPLIVKNEIGNANFVRMMIFILSLNGIVDYFFLGKYRVLLQADQKGYVIYNAQIIGTVIMTVVSIILIELEWSALWVKGTAALIYILRSVIVALYVKKKYPEVDYKAEPDMSSFSQRWAALLHQIVGMIVNNASVILITVMVPVNALVEVSVYSVYNLVAYALYTLLSSIGNGIRASFGQVMANGETEVLKKSFSTYEYVFYIGAFFCYTCMSVLLYPFIGLYCMGFADAQIYSRWSLVVLFTLVGFFQTIRTPSHTMIIGAGHFKQTQGRAIIEATINILISLSLVSFMGIEGVLLGMLASFIYRDIDIWIYSERHFLSGTIKKTLVRFLRNLITALLLAFAGIRIIPMQVHGWIEWFLYAAAFAVVALMVFFVVNIAFEKEEFSNCINRFKEMFFKKRV